MENPRPETGGLRDPHDSRDHPLFSAEEFQEHAQAGLPSADGAAATDAQPFILKDLPPIYDQGKVGSCTANAACAALRYAHRRATGKSYESFQPSRLFAWYYGRIATDPADLAKKESKPMDMDAATHNRGSWARAVIHSFLMYGVCEEKFWPYGTPTHDTTGLFNNLKTPPNPAEPKSWADASYDARSGSRPSNAKALLGREDNIPSSINYYRVFDPSVTPMVDPTTGLPTSSWDVIYNKPPIPVLEKVLRDGFPFIFGTDTFGDNYSFYNDQCPNGVYKKPGSDLVRDGGHTMMAVGYDAAKRLFLIQNSWGDKYYGQKTGGRFWMPYEWFELEVDKRPVVRDYWVIKYGGKTA